MYIYGIVQLLMTMFLFLENNVHVSLPHFDLWKEQMSYFYPNHYKVPVKAETVRPANTYKRM